jgi:U1 small nuclear ribonucleoprotein
MTDKLPPNLLALFAPRPPLRWVEAPDYAPEKRRTAAIEGLAGYLPDLKHYKENDDSVPTESWLEGRDRKKLEKTAALEDLANNVSSYCMLRLALLFEFGLNLLTSPADKPVEDPNIRGDAFKTLIVARLSYEADERDLEREFGRFGPIERVSYPFSSGTYVFQAKSLTRNQIRIVVDTHAHDKPNKKKKPHRGYAFVVFEREKDMRGN